MSLKLFNPKDSPFEKIYADITHKCNMSCTNCYIPNRTIPDMELEKFSLVVSQLPKMTEIRLIGGEPTLNPFLIEFIKITQKYGHRAVLVSNGLKLADPKYVELLKNAGLKFCYVSLSGFNDDTIYAKTDNMICAEKKLSAVSNLELHGIEVGIGCLLLKGVNDHIIKELLDFAATLKVPTRINFRNIGKIGRFLNDPKRYLSMHSLIELISKATNVTEDKVVKFQISPHQIRFPVRLQKKKVIWIKITDWQPDGAVNPDPNNLRRGRITENYQLASFFEHVKENEFQY